MHYIGIEQASNDRLGFAIFIAAALHAILILGLTFSPPDNDYYAPQIEVTLAQNSLSEAPEDADHIAQANQAGSGNMADNTQMTSNANTPLPSQQALEQTPPPLRQQENSSATNPVLTATVARDLAATEIDKREKAPAKLDGISPEVDQLNQELATLQAALDEQTRAYSNRPRVRRLTSASTRQAVDAAYLHDWRQRLEAVGNKYYPEASLRYGIYGSLRLLVTIRHDGSLEDIDVLSSSGYAVLDDAAIKIVRMAAPYAPFPPELRATTDKLEIIRTWQFQENELSSD